MADKYFDRSHSAGGERQGAARRAERADNDPLAELARLIGQTDPFAGFPQPAPRAAANRAPTHEQDQYHRDYRGQQQPYRDGEYRADDYRTDDDRDDHYRSSRATPAPDERRSPAWLRNFSAEGARYEAPSDVDAAADHERYDHERYDDVLYGRMPDEPAARAPYYGEAGEGASDYPPQAYADAQAVTDDARKRRGMLTVGLVLALAVAGTAAAYGYRTYFGSSRRGEPPVIRADAAPTKIVPAAAPGDGAGKTINDRFGAAAGGERVVSREEQPVEIKTAVRDEPKPEPRVVLPATAQPPAAPSAPPMAMASRPAAPQAAPAGADEPRRVRTIVIRGDQPDAAAQPRTQPPAAALPAQAAQAAVPRPAQSAPQRPAAAAPASGGPMQITPPQPAVEAHARTAAVGTVPSAAAAGGSYMVQLSSQRSEADAQNSYRALQAKYPGVLGSRHAVIRRADLGAKGVYYRAMVGPFSTAEAAVQFCANLKTAGGQCVVPR